MNTKPATDPVLTIVVVTGGHVADAERFEVVALETHAKASPDRVETSIGHSRLARYDEFMSRIEPFTTATRAEPGNIFLEWSKSTEVLDQFVLLEGFASAEAGEAHVYSEHFKAAMEWFSSAFSEPPKIIHVDAPVDGWGQVAEL